jgi:uncharacterized membrane protein
MQLLVLGFGETEMTGEIADELRRLREHDIVRLVDLIIVRRDDAGNVATLETTDLSKAEAVELGGIAGALIGLGADGEEGMEAGFVAGAAAAESGRTPLEDQVWYVADAIPNGTTAAVAVLEHRWAIPLRDAVMRHGGAALADAWIHPMDLVAIGAEAAEAVADRPVGAA